MEKKYLYKNKDSMKILIVFFAILNAIIFVGSYYMKLLNPHLFVRILAIIYMFIAVLFLYFGKYHAKNIRLIEKKNINTKKVVEKAYTGSDYRKVYHKRSCRFADSIKAENLEESDDLNYFTNKKYKPCGICHPNKK